MKRKYWMLIIIMFVITGVIPIFQLMNFSNSIPTRPSLEGISPDYMIASDSYQQIEVKELMNSTIFIIGGTSTFIIISVGLNIFADYVFNKECSLELEQDSRLKIYNIIKENKGIHLREICRKLNKKMGVIQYHIHVLEKANIIDSIKEGRYRRFFVHDNNGDDNKTILCYLQRDSSKKILEFLLFNEEKSSHSELADYLGISSQAITWHMKKLESEGIVTFVKIGKQKYYTLSESYREVLLKELS